MLVHQNFRRKLLAAHQDCKNADLEIIQSPQNGVSFVKIYSIFVYVFLELLSDQLWIPTFKTWRLNERHYGASVGKNKDEMAREFGADQVKRWRRDYYEMPPLVEENHFDRRYAQLADQDIPHGENLQMTVQRVAPLWQDEIAPLLGSGKNVLITGHGNSLRALVKYLEDVPEDQMDTIDIPNAQPIHYRFDKNLQIVNKSIL